MYNGRNQLVDDCSNMEEKENYYSTFAVFDEVDLTLDLTNLSDEELEQLIELYEPLLNAGKFDKAVFRGDTIEYVECSNINSIVDANEYVKNKNKDVKEHCKFRIRWRDKLYTAEQFFKEAFKDYKIFPYKIRPIDGNEKLFYLSKGQRKQRQYEALQYHYKKYFGKEIVAVSQSDIDELKYFFFIYSENIDTARDLCSRIHYKDGLSKMVTFGATISVDGKNKDNYCYMVINKTEKGFTCVGIDMTWEKWAETIKYWSDNGNQLFQMNNMPYSDVEKYIYYQDKIYLTLTGKYNEIMRTCTKQYFNTRKADFPTGQIPNKDLTFNIDYDEDIEIYRSHENKHLKEVNGHDKAYIKFNTLNAAIDEIVTRQQLLALKWNDKNIARYIEYGFMKRIAGKKGAYMILIE